MPLGDGVRGDRGDGVNSPKSINGATGTEGAVAGMSLVKNTIVETSKSSLALLSSSFDTKGSQTPKQFLMEICQNILYKYRCAH